MRRWPSFGKNGMLNQISCRCETRLSAGNSGFLVFFSRYQFKGIRPQVTVRLQITKPNRTDSQRSLFRFSSLKRMEKFLTRTALG